MTTAWMRSSWAAFSSKNPCRDKRSSPLLDPIEIERDRSFLRSGLDELSFSVEFPNEQAKPLGKARFAGAHGEWMARDQLRSIEQALQFGRHWNFTREK